MDHGHGAKPTGAASKTGDCESDPPCHCHAWTWIGHTEERRGPQDQRQATKFGASAIAIITDAAAAAADDDDEQMKHGMDGTGFSSSAPLPPLDLLGGRNSSAW